jgi:acyl-CoA hydrolase
MAENWSARHRAKIGSAEEAVAGIASGQRVFVHTASAVPRVLIDALVARAGDLRDVRITHLHTAGEAPYVAPNMRRSFTHEALFVGPNVREAVNDGQADYIPMFLSEIPAALRSGLLATDVVLLNVSPPDRHGYCSLGTSVDCMLAALATAKHVVAQINHAMPRTHGSGFIHVDRIDRAVEVDMPPFEVPPEEPSEVERRIGEHVASLIPDGATMQMGIGTIPNAVLAALGNHSDLGVHTEMFSDGVVELVERGVITGRRNPLNPGKIVSAFLMGSKRLYDFVDDNPMVQLFPVDYTNDTAIIRRNYRMVAVNSAIEVDLTGQVCACSIGDRIYSGIGGQVDFMRGAVLCPDGVAILALPSTGAGGKFSRIVSHLKPGAMLTLSQGHVHFIVTEYGIADLYAKSLRERARALIDIAHPDFREELERVARGLNRL